VAIYALDIYAKALYGIDVTVRFSVQPFQALQYEHGQLQVSWTTPRQVSSSLSAGKAWSTLRLVRNLYGIPANENDGLVLLEAPNTAPVETYLDLTVPIGRFAYYAIYVLTVHDAWDATHSYSVGDQITYSGSNWIALAANQNQTPGSGSSWSTTSTATEWVFAGACVGLSVADWSYSDFLFNTQPRAYKVSVVETTASSPDFNLPLRRFDQVFGFAWDIIRSENDALLHINDIEATRDRFVWAIAEQMGIGDEVPDTPTLRRLRVLDATTIAQQKGSAAGLETLVYDTTGWQATIAAGYNLLLNMDQAAFAHPVYPTWDPNTRYKVGEIVVYSGLLYTCTAAALAQNPSTATSYWSVFTTPQADPANVLYNPRTGGESTWTAAAPTGASLSVIVNGVPASGTVPARNCLAISSNDSSAAQAKAVSVSPTLFTTWSSSASYVVGQVVSYNSLNYVCTLADSAGGVTPDSDPSHWNLYSAKSGEALAIAQGVPLAHPRPWNYQTTYNQGDHVTANGSIYEALYASINVAPSGYRIDSRGWRWISDEAVAYAASVYYQRQSPTASTQVECDIVWYDSQDNALVAIGARPWPPLYDEFQLDGPIGGTEPSYPTQAQYANPFPISWIDEGGPWRVDDGILHTTYPAVHASGELLVMSELAYGSLPGSSDPLEWAWVTLVSQSYNTNLEQGLVFRLDPVARTYWMLSRTRLTKNSYASDFSSVTITPVTTWTALPDNTRVGVQVQWGTGNITGFAYTASGTNTTLFTVTDTFSQSGHYFGVGER
jgi:hypothetical protein